MWMGEVELADGSVVHIYKHRATRRSLHLCTDGRAFVYVGQTTYREADPHDMVDLVLAGWRPDWRSARRVARARHSTTRERAARADCGGAADTLA